jgi:hypothetical protein
MRDEPGRAAPIAGCAVLPAGQCVDDVQVRLRFPAGGAVLHYRATRRAALRLASELGRYGVEVSIAPDPDRSLAPLPYADAWE